MNVDKMTGINENALLKDVTDLCKKYNVEIVALVTDLETGYRQGLFSDKGEELSPKPFLLSKLTQAGVVLIKMAERGEDLPG